MIKKVAGAAYFDIPATASASSLEGIALQCRQLADRFSRGNTASLFGDVFGSAPTRVQLSALVNQSASESTRISLSPGSSFGLFARLVDLFNQVLSFLAFLLAFWVVFHMTRRADLHQYSR